MSEVTITNKIECINLSTPEVIFGDECIGDSLDKIVSNFDALKQNDIAICESLNSTITAVEQSITQAVTPPIQSVIMWAGDIGNESTIIDSSTLTTNTTAYIYPNGVKDDSWAICTGAIVNGIATPNLIGRFIVGAGVKPTDVSFNDITTPILYPDNTGGADVHTLATDEIPTLSVSTLNSTNLFSKDPSLTTALGDIPIGTGTTVSAITAASFTADRDTVESAFVNSSIGTLYNESHENRPPYYALYYAIRVK